MTSLRSLLLSALVASGCSGDEPTDSPATDTAPTATQTGGELFAAEPSVTAPNAPYADVGGARRVQVQATESAALEVALEGPEGRRTWTWPAAEMHDVPLVGMRPDTPYTLELTLIGGDERDAWPELPLTGDPWPADAPDIEVLPVDRSDPIEGYTLFGAGVPELTQAWVILLDEEAVPVWWALLDTAVGDLRLTEEGTLLGLGAFSIVEFDWLGNELWHGVSAPVVRDDQVRLGVDAVHHEVTPLADGTLLTLDTSVVEVDALPVSYEELDTFAPATIVGNGIVQLDRDGTVLGRVELHDVLPTTKIGFDSLEPQRALNVPDWVHANAVVVDDDGGWVVSLRHLDAVVKIRPSGELAWILGDPAGWPTPAADALLAASGSVGWPYHPHAPELHRDAEGLTVVLFDNHNHGHTPYTSGPLEQPPSRVVAFRVDEDAGTVEQLWAHEVEHEGPLYSFALGDADLLANGHVLGVWGMMAAEGDQLNPSVGRGDLSARIVQLDPITGERVLDLRIGTDRVDSARGWSVYRAERILQLHPSP